MGLISLTNRSNFWVDTKFLEKRISFPILRLLQESFSSLAGTSIGHQKIQPFLPQSNRRIKKGETEEKASYFLLSARKSTLLRKITKNVLSSHEHVFVTHINFPPFPPNPVSSSPDLLLLGSNASGFFMLFNTHNESLSTSELYSYFDQNVLCNEEN
jgi:hypothetical protein